MAVAELRACMVREEMERSAALLPATAAAEAAELTAGAPVVHTRAQLAVLEEITKAALVVGPAAQPPMPMAPLARTVEEAEERQAERELRIPTAAAAWR